MIDKDAPSITNPQLYKYAAGATVGTSTPAANQMYSSDVYLSGEWYIVATATDDSGITAGKYDSSTNVYGYKVEEITNSGSSDDISHNVIVKTVGETGFTYYIPVTSNTGSVSYRLTVYDKSDSHSNAAATWNLNIDNEAPVIKSLTGNGEDMTTGSSVIANKNNRFTLGGEVEDGNSGFSKLAFYFIRNGSTAQRIYDPMIPFDSDYDSQANYTGANSSTHSRVNIGDADNKTLDGRKLYGKNVAGSASDNTFTATTAANVSGNAHIRRGGLVYIGGAYRVIDTISGGVVTFAPALADGITDTEGAFFAYAQVRG